MKQSLKRSLAVLLIALLGLFVMTGCKKSDTATEDDGEAAVNTEGATTELANKTIILATTTSTENSGLLAEILPKFTEETGIEVKVVAVGTGQALQMGKDGEADILLVHAKSSEEEFVAEGHGTDRSDVMYNDFIIVGPQDDPANVQAEAGQDTLAAFRQIANQNVKFYSRGDDSGTHKMELNLWKLAGITPEGDWYLSAGRGMGEVLQMASEGLGYTLTDRATYLAMEKDLDLKVIVEGDQQLFNQYGVIPVNPEKNDQINAEGAQIFKEWILSERGQQIIGEFGKAEYGQSLFIPNYQQL